MGPWGRQFSLPKALPDPSLPRRGNHENHQREHADHRGRGRQAQQPDVIIFGETMPGFGIRFRQGSKRQSYIVQYECGGWQKRLLIGTTAILEPDEARKLAKRELAKVTLGANPRGEKAKAKEQAKVTLQVIAEQYLANKKDELRESSYHEVERYLLKTWKPLHRIPIRQIELHHVANRQTARSRRLANGPPHRAGRVGCNPTQDILRK
jgi:hypothetical protein